MTAPVGIARIEVIGDMGAFAGQTEAKVRSAMQGAGKAADVEMAAMSKRAGVRGAEASAAYGAQGAKAGAMFGGGITKALNSVLGTNLSGTFFTGAVFAGFGIAAVKMAGDFQTQMTRLVTAAGESKAAIGTVSAGVLQLARDTGTSTKTLADAGYMIESAGYHGRDALLIMKAAAEGAKIDMADTGTVANALTTAMTDMKAPAGSAATVMSQLVATVGRGKMTMDELSSALHSVLPNAAALGLGIGQVGGAIATMTGQGISAQLATQNLNHVIVALAAPTSVMTNSMAAYGLNASVVARDLGKNGLTGTLQTLTDHIAAKMGPAGLTMIHSLNESQIAAGKATTMFKSLDPATQKIAKGYMDGTVHAGAFRKATAAMTGEQANLARQWLVSENRANGFNALLKSGSPQAQTFTAALAGMTGGQTGLQVALHLTGKDMDGQKGNMSVFKDNVAAIGKAAAESGGHVKDWGEKQNTFNLQMSRVKELFATLAIQLGTYLLPALTAVAKGFADNFLPAINAIAKPLGDVISFISDNIGPIGTFVGIIGTAAAAMYVWRNASLAWTAVQLAALSVTGGLTGAWTALTAAMDANPLMLIVIAVAALAAGVVYAYQHFKPFRDILDSIGRTLKAVFVPAFDAVRKAVGEAVGWIVDHWKIFAAIILAPVLPLIGLVVLIVKHFGTIKKAIGDAVSWVIDHWKLFAAIILLPVLPLIALVVLVVKHFGTIKRVLGEVVGVVAGAFSAAWHTAVAAVSAVGAALAAVFLPPIRLVVSILRVAALVVYALFGGAFLLAKAAVLSVAGVLKGAFMSAVNAVTKAWKALAVFLTGAWQAFAGVATKAWNAITAVVTKVWNALWAGVKAAWTMVAGWIMAVWHGWVAVVTKAWNAISAPVTRIWNALWGAVKAAWAAVSGYLVGRWQAFVGTVTAIWHAISGAVTTVWNTMWAAVKSGWSNIVSFLTGAWSGFVNTVRSAWSNITNPIKTAWADVATAISKAWDSVKHGMGVGINAAIGVVNMFIGAIDSVLDKLPGGFSISKISLVSLASGGVVPGRDTGRDYVPALLRGGEGVLVPGAVHAVGGAAGIDAINSRYGGGSGRNQPGHYSGGGLVDTLWGGAKALGGAVAGAAGFVAHTAGDIVTAVRAGLADAALAGLHVVEAPIRAGMNLIGEPAKSVGSGGLDYLNTEVDAFIRGSAKKAAAAAAASVGGVMTGDHVALIMQALGLAGAPQSLQNAADVDAIVKFESGWNNRAINLTDSNAQKGTPSMGLMQTIIGTFEAYRLASLPDDPYNPLANLVAGIRYAYSRYGGLENVPGIQAVHSGGAYVGYDSGGLLHPGLTMAWNGTGRAEHVVPADRAPAAAPIVNVYPRASQSEHEIGVIAARELGWAARQP